MPEPAQFKTDRTHPGRWTITFSNPPINMFVPTTIVELGGLITRETLAAAKAQINRFGTPTAAELQSSIDLFFPLLALPRAQARRAKVRDVGYGVPSDFELNFGRYLPAFGPAHEGDMDTQPELGTDVSTSANVIGEQPFNGSRQTPSAGS